VSDLLGADQVVGVDRSNVAVPTVHAAVALPFINDPLQTLSCAPKVVSALDLAAALRRGDAPLAIFRISPPPSVASLVLLALRRKFALLGLGLSTDGGETAVAPCLPIEG
jgi:hypothetical protein